jgi:predicted kinase
MNKLTIIRGASGSGKTTTAQNKVSENPGTIHLEADQYFVDSEGNYNWRKEDLHHAHRWAEDHAYKALKEGKNVVVANTFIRKKEMKWYLQAAEKFGAEIEIIVCEGNYQNVHGVPQEKVDQMKAKFER